MCDRDSRRDSIWTVWLVEVMKIMCNFPSAWLQDLYRYDPETYSHSIRTTKYFDDFLRFVGVRAGERKRLLFGAALHDIGKMAVPISILQKNGALSQEERREIQKHPRIAFTWMMHLRFPPGLADIPHMHHERWDGSGYPLVLKGSAIPRHVRLFSVIDVWDAMRNIRPYRDAIPEEMVLQHLRNSSGTLFGPEAVDAFLKWRGRYVRVERTAAIPSVARYPVVI